MDWIFMVAGAGEMSELEAYRALIRYWHERDGSSDIDRDVLQDLEHIYLKFNEAT